MRFTRRYLGEVGLGTLLLGAAALTGRPEPLLAATGVVGVLLGGGLAFRRDAAAAVAALELTRSPDRRRVAAGSTVAVRFVATLPAPVDVDLRATAAVPVGAVASGRSARTLTLRAGETRAETTYDLRWSVAGEHGLGDATVAVADRTGRFVVSTRVDADAAVTVDAGRHREVDGGADLRSSLDHDGETVVVDGTDVAGVRRYLPTDRFSRVDWKATARLNELYVRETTADADPVTALFVDHRARTAAGTPSGSELDYLGNAALAVERRARESGHPLALYAVGDEGVTATVGPTRTAGGYAAVRETLVALAPTPSRTGERGGCGGSDRVRAARDDRRGTRLAREDSSFGRVLRPFLGRSPAADRRVDGDPLSRAVRAHVARLGENVHVVVCTDDRDPGELYETVRAARAAVAVTAMLVPGVSFDPFPGTEAAYDRLAAFETLRRRLDGLDRVRTVDVGPAAPAAASRRRRPEVTP